MTGAPLRDPGSGSSPSAAATASRGSNTGAMSLLKPFALVMVSIVATMHLLVFAEDVLIPLLFGFYLSTLLYRPARSLQSLLIPQSVASLFMVALVALALAAAGNSLRSSADRVLRVAPELIEQFRDRALAVEEALDDVREDTGRVKDALADVMESDDRAAQTVVLKDAATLEDRVLAEAARAVWLTSLTLLICYFFLVGGDELVRNIAMVLPTRRRRVATFRLFRMLRSHLASYLTATLIVNLSFGLVIGVVLFLLGVELPFLWGIAAGLLRYIPFVGSIVVIVAVTAVTVQQGPALPLLVGVPLFVLVLNFVTGNLIDPLVHSRNFQLNPIAIFISIIFWGWIWGAPGLLIAVPSVITLAVVCANSPRLANVYLVLCFKS